MKRVNQIEKIKCSLRNREKTREKSQNQKFVKNKLKIEKKVVDFI